MARHTGREHKGEYRYRWRVSRPSTALRAGKRPDVIHCHDWQTGLVPVLLYEQYGHLMPDQRACYTIHNFRHQGTSGEQVLWVDIMGYHWRRR